MSKPSTPDASLAGKFYWPSDEYSVPADNLCWNRAPSPNADFFCVRALNHLGKCQFHWSPTIRDRSHRASSPDASNGDRHD